MRVSKRPGVKFLHMVSGRVSYRYAAKVVEAGPGDSLLFEASALHGIELIHEGGALPQRRLFRRD